MELEELKKQITHEISLWSPFDWSLPKAKLHEKFVGRRGVTEEMFNDAVASLLDEHVIIEIKLHSKTKLEKEPYLVLTGSGIGKYKYREKAVREYKPHGPRADDPKILRVVGSGGQTMGHVEAPQDWRDCIAYGIAIIIFAVFILVIAMS